MGQPTPVAVLMGMSGFPIVRPKAAGLSANLWRFGPREYWRNAARCHLLVIPVLLPGLAKGAVPIGSFLGLNTWVDLRAGLDETESFQRLVAGAQGQPIDKTAAEKLLAGLCSTWMSAQTAASPYPKPMPSARPPWFIS
jgi:hypothetical protein